MPASLSPNQRASAKTLPGPTEKTSKMAKQSSSIKNCLVTKRERMANRRSFHAKPKSWIAYTACFYQVCLSMRFRPRSEMRISKFQARNSRSAKAWYWVCSGTRNIVETASFKKASPLIVSQRPERQTKVRLPCISWKTTIPPSSAAKHTIERRRSWAEETQSHLSQKRIALQQLASTADML